jgi:hypothetical protein
MKCKHAEAVRLNFSRSGKNLCNTYRSWVCVVFFLLILSLSFPHQYLDGLRSQVPLPSLWKSLLCSMPGRSGEFTTPQTPPLLLLIRINTYTNITINNFCIEVIPGFGKKILDKYYMKQKACQDCIKQALLHLLQHLYCSSN